MLFANFEFWSIEARSLTSLQRGGERTRIFLIYAVILSVLRRSHCGILADAYTIPKNPPNLLSYPELRATFPNPHLKSHPTQTKSNDSNRFKPISNHPVSIVLLIRIVHSLWPPHTLHPASTPPLPGPSGPTPPHRITIPLLTHNL